MKKSHWFVHIGCSVHSALDMGKYPSVNILLWDLQCRQLCTYIVQLESLHYPYIIPDVLHHSLEQWVLQQWMTITICMWRILQYMWLTSWTRIFTTPPIHIKYTLKNLMVYLFGWPVWSFWWEFTIYSVQIIIRHLQLFLLVIFWELNQHTYIRIC